MRKNLSSMLLLTLAGAGLAGCGDGSSEQGALSDALKTVRVAEAGFVPAKPGEPSASLASYRQETLGQAAQQLDAAIQNGTPAEKVAAQRLKADIEASAARNAAREAAVEYAGIAPRAVEMVTYAVAADRAAARGAGLDERQPEVIKAINEDIAKQNARKTELQNEASKLKQQLEAEQAALKEIIARRDAAIGQSQKLRDQAFVKEGDEQFKLYDDAAAAEREGTKADAEAARRQLNIDMLSSQLAVVNSQLALTDNLVKELGDRVKAAQTRQGEIEQGTAAATAERDAQLGKLLGELQQLQSVYNQAVDTKLAAAADRMGRAIQLLQQAQGQAQPAARQVIQFDLLAAHVAQAHILSQHLTAADGFGDTLAAIAQTTSKLQGANVQPVQQALAELTQKKAALATAANQAIQSGKELAGQLGENAQKQSQRLDAYAQQVAAVK